MGNITINSNITGGGGGGTGDVGGGSNLTTVGAIPYVSASGVLNQDPTQLFWDAANNRLGVGTNLPSFSLDITGTPNTVRVYGGAGVSDSTKMVVRAGAGQTGGLIEIQTSGGITVGTISTTGLSMPNVASDGNLYGAVHQVANSGRIDFSNGSVYSQSIRRRSDAIIAFDNNTAIGTTPGNARDVMVRGVYAAETTSDPSAGDLSIAGANAQDTFRLYMKNDKLVVAYQISGTVNYLTIPLDGATTTWTQSTTAP